MGKFIGFGRRTKVVQRNAKNCSQQTDGEKKIKRELQTRKQKIKRSQIKDEKFKKAIKKFFDEVSKIVSTAIEDQTPYTDRVSRIETYIARRKNKKLFSFEDFITERYDIILEWCYICHRTLFSKQASILRKDIIKPNIPKNHLDEMPKKMIVCHRCLQVLSKTTKIPSQSFWNNLYPGDIPDILKSLTSMEVRMIQRMIPFMKIVKYQGRFGQYGLQGQAVLFAQDVTEVLDILPRKPESMDLIMVVESLKNIERQREMIINKNRLQKALDWLLEFNERYKDVKIDRTTLENLEIDYSQICVVGLPKVNNQNEVFKDKWETLNIPGASSSRIVKALHCKRHDLSVMFNEHAGKQSLSMCISSLVRGFLKEISMWDPVDLDMVLEEGHSLHIESMKQITNNIVTFDTIKRQFSLYDESIEIALVDKVIFKRNQLYDFVENCLNCYGRGVIYTNKVYLSIIKHDEEFFFFDARPRGTKGYACTKNKKNEYNGSAIVMRFSNFNLFIKRLESQFKANKLTEYTLASVIVSQPEDDVLVSTFGDETPSLHTNPIFKVKTSNVTHLKDNGKDQIKCTPDIDLRIFSEQLTLNNVYPLYASHCQADIRYNVNYRNSQCTANSCAAIINSLITPLDQWTMHTMDEVLHAGNDLYIESCDKIQTIRWIAASEIVDTTNIFERNISLTFTWSIADKSNDHMKRTIQDYFEKDFHTNGILTSQGKSYAIMFYDNQYWFFDSHNNPPHGKALLNRTDLNGLMEILYYGENPKICGSNVRYDISHVDIAFSEHEDFVAESRLNYISERKRSQFNTSRQNEVLKKIKLEEHLSNKFDLEHGYYITPSKIADCRNFIDDFESIIDENEFMIHYRQLYDTRKAKDDDAVYRFYVTPLKNEQDAYCTNESYKRRLDLFEHDTCESEIMDQLEPATESTITPLGYVSTAPYIEKYRNLAQLDGFDIVACISAILNLTIDSFTGWSSKRLQNVLDEADKIVPSFNFVNDKITIFGETFHFDKFFFGQRATSDIIELLTSFFQIHDFGLLRYNNKEYAISYLNDYYCFFDPHSCNSNGYPSENGTSCVIVTNNFDVLIGHIVDRLSFEDKSLQITIQNKERFTLHAMQIERINDTNIVQKDLNYKNMSSPSSIKSSMQHNFVTETEHLATSIAAVATNFINSFEIWDTKFINSILKDGINIFQHLKPNKKIDIEKDFKMFSLCDLNLQTAVYEVLFHETDLSSILNTFFNSYESGIIRINDKFFTVMFKNESYCLFDSHGTDHQGYKGNTCGIIVKNLSQLEDLILSRAVRCHGNDDIMYTFYRLEVKMINGVNFEIYASDLNRPKTPEVEIDTSLFDAPIDCPISLMRPIDDIIPRPEEIYEVDIENKDLNSENIPLISIKRATKPPLSHRTNRRFEEYCFPVLFPKGLNGLNEEREIKMTALEYFQSRIMGKDPRFHSKEYLLFALNYVENDKVSKNISVCGKIQQNHQNITNVASNLHLVMRTIRGTSAYWGHALSDLLAMVKVLGPGTAFLTLSCNDLNWDFMLKACLQAEGKGNVDPMTLTQQEKQHLVENNPVMVSRLFNREIQNMLKLLKNGEAFKDGSDSWKVTDYWYRIEWQQRGSPHCHMIVWIKDFPKLDTPEGIKAMESLCRCDIPEDDENLANLVKRYQRHYCTATCYKNRNKTIKEEAIDQQKTEKNNKTCRFGFPRSACKETKVLDPESTEFIKNGRRLVQMKRNENARYINNYNANILHIWQANMDIQFITSHAIVAYVAKYSCKSEPSSLHQLINDAIKEAESNNEETRKALFKVTMKILNERQVSCCESATRLCHLPMKGCSRKVVFINSSRPEERYRMLNVQSTNPVNNSYFSNIIDRYQIRPDDMEDLSLAEFAMEYQPHYHKKNDDVVINEENGDCEFIEDEDNLEDMLPKPKKGIKLKDGKSYIKKRTRSAIFRSRYFSLTDNRSNYFYGLLLLHLPFRSETELLQKLRENDNAPIESYSEEATDLAFFEKRHLLRPFNDTCTVEEYLQYSLELQDAIRQMEALMTGLNSTPDIDNVNEQNRTLQDDIRDGNLKNVQSNLPSADLLNSDQRKLFQLVQEWIRADHRKENLSQILMFTTGSAGTGKSFLIAQIIKIVKDYFEPKYPQTRVIFVTAPTGIAARLINGQTLHNALSLGIELGEVSKYKPLTGNYLKQRRELWKNVKFLIIDEISMVSYEMFKNIDLRLKELMNNNQPFGGVNILVFGDLMQLPPVLGHCIYERPHYTSEFHLWRLFDFCELKQNMRQKNDQSFVELLNAMRVGQLTHEHRKMLVRRVENQNLKREGIFDDMCSTLISPINRTVEEHNITVLHKLVVKNYETEKEKYLRNPEYKGYYEIRAIDELQNKTNNPDWEKFIPKQDNKCAGVPKELKLAVGARVMLRRNIDVSGGLVNGSLGVIKSFNWGGCFLKDQSEPGDLPESVTVSFDGIGDRDIRPQRCEFNAKGGLGKVDRLQLPLILAWAVTAHKLQGVTVETAVIDMGSTIFEKGQAYVMLSRAKNLDKILILRNFDVTKLEKKYVNTKAITEMNRLRKLQQVNYNSLLQARELSDSRMKLN